MADTIINGYRLLQPLKSENAGFSRWTIAEKNGREWFLKELMNPVYPPDNSPHSDKDRMRLRARCHAWQVDTVRRYEAINRASDGNIVRIEAFFRWGSRYYIASRRVIPTGSFDAVVSDCNLAQRLQLCLVLGHAMMRLHNAGVVHADLKPDNLLPERTADGGVTLKMVDFEGSFFEREGTDEINGDQVYFAPETVRFMQGDPDARPRRKSDVFAAGLIFHRILTGALPALPAGCDYAFEALLDGQGVTLSPLLPDRLQSVIARMLAERPEMRCTMEMAYHDLLRLCRGTAGTVGTYSDAGEEGSRVRLGRGFSRSEAPPDASKPSAFHQAGDL